MLLRQLQYFISVVENKSFTEAAWQCAISQSAISQQIQALENELGVQLLIRHNRTFSLTPAGEYFYRHGKSVLGEMNALCRKTIEIGGDKELQLRIGFLSGYSGRELQQAIASFSLVYPELSISVINKTHEELYELLRSGDVDIVLNDQRRAFSDEYINYRLMESNCFAEVSAASRFAEKRHVTVADLKYTPCILVAPAVRQQQECEFYEKTLGFGGEFLFADNLDSARLMVASNRGFFPVESVGSLPSPGPAVVRVPLFRGGSQLKRTYCLFWRKENANYYIEEFALAFGKMVNAPEQPLF